MVESLKVNKEIDILGKYVVEHILPVFNTKETQSDTGSANFKAKVRKNKNGELERVSDWIGFKG